MAGSGTRRAWFAPAIVLLALVFLLGAADPTPCYLGMTRLPGCASGPSDGASIAAVLPAFDLPVSEQARRANGCDRLVVAPPIIATPCVDLLPVLLAVVSTAAPPSFSDLRAPVPRRC